MNNYSLNNDTDNIIINTNYQSKFLGNKRTDINQQYQNKTKSIDSINNDKLDAHLKNKNIISKKHDNIIENSNLILNPNYNKISSYYLDDLFSNNNSKCSFDNIEEYEDIDSNSKYNNSKSNICIKNIVFKYVIIPKFDNKLLASTYDLNNKLYYSLIEIFDMYKHLYNIDYQKFSFKDDVKISFKNNLNLYLKNHSYSYGNEKILIDSNYIDNLLYIIVYHINLPKLEKSIEYFKKYKDEFKIFELEELFSYLPKSAYFVDKLYTTEELPKKRNNQYTKINNQYRWLNYAWDIIGTIKNCRKSYIFSRYNEDSNEKNKTPQLGLENLEIKLKEKQYNNFTIFEKDLLEMFAVTERYWKRIKNSDIAQLCFNISLRIKKIIDKLKKENKI